MDFEITENQKQIKALVRDFCEREIDNKRIDDLEDTVHRSKTCEELRAVFPRDILEKLHEVGLRQLCVPERFGGMDSGSDANMTQVLAVEEMGYWAGSASVLLATPFMVASASTKSPLVTEEQREKFFTMFMNNPKIWLGGSVSDPAGGTDPHLPYVEPGIGLTSIFAHKDGEEWVINGDKMYCSGGAVADAMCVAVRTDKEGPVTESTSAFIVPTKTKGVSQVLNRFTGVELCGNAQTFFDDVRLPEDALVGEVNKGYYSMIENAMLYKWLMLSPFVGEMQRIYDDVAEFAKQRVQGGKPLIQHSHVAVMLGEAAVNIEALRGLCYRAAWETDKWENSGKGPNNALFWSMGYLYQFKKFGLRLSEIANEIYGGIGKSLDMPLEKFNRRIFAWQAAGSTTGINAIKCSRAYNNKI